MVLEQEIQQYEKDLSDMLKTHDGEFVVYYGIERLGFYKNLDEALKAGHAKYGDVPFLAREVDKIYLNGGDPVYKIRKRVKIIQED